MAEDNIFSNLSDENRKKQLFLKKIKLTEFPELKKIYIDFFNNGINYFNGKYKNKYIIVGKIHEYKEKEEKEEISPKTKNKVIKNKKYLLNTSKISKITIDDNSHLDKKHMGGKYNKNAVLKNGQQYIDEAELDELFKKFKTVQNINKKKANNFITVKDLIEKKVRINPSAKNIMKVENILDNDLQLQKPTENNIYNKTISNSINNNKLKKNHLFDSKSGKNILKNNNKNNFFPSLTKINSVKDISSNCNGNEKFDNKKFVTFNNFYQIFDKKDKIKTRNKIINRQNQFLLDYKDSKKNINKTEKNYFAQILANQEQALLKSSKSQLLLNNYGNKISKKINKPKKDLLILNIDNFRIIQELRNKFDILNKRLEPEHYYNWTNDLRSISNTKSNTQKKDKNNIYRIRNPMKNYGLYKSNFGLRNLKKIINDINKDSHNCEGLIIKGKELLKFEYDNIKSIKNKKIINNYESYLPTTDLEDKSFANKNKILQK